jgi:hypothetical protein
MIYLYLDLLTPEERIAKGKAIKKPPIKGLLPLEKTKVAMLRHGNEGDLLRKVVASMQPPKPAESKKNRNVRFKDGTKQPKQ